MSLPLSFLLVSRQEHGKEPAAPRGLRASEFYEARKKKKKKKVGASDQGDNV